MNADDLLADQVIETAVNDSAGYITATIVNVNTDNTVDVRIGDGAEAGDDNGDVIATGQTITGIAYPAWLQPKTGLVVWLVQQGTWITIVGSPAQDGSAPPVAVAGATIHLGNTNMDSWSSAHGLPTDPRPRDGDLGVSGYGPPIRDMVYRGMASNVPVTATGSWAKLDFDSLVFNVETYGVLRLGIHLAYIGSEGTANTYILGRVYNNDSNALISPRVANNYIRVSAPSAVSASHAWMSALTKGTYRFELWGYKASTVTTATLNYLSLDVDFLPGAAYMGTRTSTQSN
jgi:hypothetical protein